MAVCTVRGTLRRADGTPAAGHHVIAAIRSTVDDQGGQVGGTPVAGIISEQIEAFTDSFGEFAIDLIQKATFEFSIPSINLRKLVVIPELADIDFVELI